MKSMEIGKLLDYQLYVQRENDFYHQSHQVETEFFDIIRTGNIEKLESIQRQFSGISDDVALDGKGVLSDNPVRNQIYHLVTNAALISRICIDDGLPQETAFTLTDLYIRRADVSNSVEEIRRINDEMVLEFTSQMHKMHNQNVFSPAIKMCISYICDNLHTRITTTDLAEHTGYNRSYLSVLFKKETGQTIQEYVFAKRIETATNMLAQTDYSCSQIALTLCFASQSYFCMQFKKAVGMTPKQFRLNNRSRSNSR